MRLWNRFWCHLTDEAVGLLTLHAFLRNGRQSPLRGSTAAEFQDLFSGELERFYQPAATLIPWEHKRHVRTWSDGTSVDDFQFPSPITSGFPENDIVPLRRWKPSKNDAGLTVVGVDGIVQISAGWFDRLARRVGPAGVEVVMMDAPFNFRRTPKGRRPGQLIVGGDLDHQLAVARQAVLDLWTVIRTLQAEGRRVGLVGVSFGGWLSLTTSLVAQNLDFVIALAPPVDMFRILKEGGTVVRAVRRGLGKAPFDEFALRRMSQPTSPLRWSPPRSARRTILHLAEHDRFVPNRRIEQLAERWNARLVRHDIGHIGMVVRNDILDQVAREVTEFAGQSAEASEKPALRIMAE